MRVAVGMSGGVDSSVAALLLKENGHEVIGVTLRFHTTEACEVNGTHNVCCSPKDVQDAARVSQKLGIPHLTFDWEKIFKERVIDYFVREYSLGRTPNPCALCNREVKTGYFARYLKAVADIDRLATGHYARIEEHPAFGRIIRRGVDSRRDQSYFLALVRKEDLELLDFPLGSMTKDEVREIARKHNLDVAEKRDSQEVCFLMGRSPGEYIETAIGKREGPIKHISGKVLGKHTGIYNFTIGQRRGLGISYGKPLYVVDIDPRTNTVLVGEEEYLYNDTLYVKGVNFHVPPEQWHKVSAQIRYRHTPVEVESFKRLSDVYEVRFKEDVRGITPGQVIAFYNEDILLGGGIIEGTGT
ncbi:tRNA (5-methylaminomethyl-2-thiouridylate)-methyltransferase [Hydrogenivirga caldilitoris]|uniref:tRNA-specific 2-thiouridylase MnmA n=1 Tax=Hydrogenivirga caldilitoris TaxID=246264 RepID=A0A497XU40_9AQUI|nr:tRNA 2-thiouridine(34) synthase MnmA [Hydrogenivirga caldilitoris]RLJ71539.1 tRNA (5-methylaminomethyl-2-thiouridylate)-methyltransferase [Hydrogenivirga caldilitoris]